MYCAAHFEESRPEVLRGLMRLHPLGTLVTMSPGGLRADHVPCILEDGGPHGVLRAHVARANPLWRDTLADQDSLVVFQGPNTYITPSWYATKHETGKVVPTWNYMVVHAYGRLRVIDDAPWVHALVTRLTDRFESARDTPWKVSDAPADFVGQQLRAIVGIEIPIDRIEGKWKVSQNRVAADREGVTRGLREVANPDTETLAREVEERGR